MKNHLKLFAICIFLITNLASCKNEKEKKKKKQAQIIENNVFVSPLGKKFTISTPSQKMLDLYATAKKEFENNPNEPENIIWYGRRTAYLAKYEEAIQIYSNGIKKFPNNPKLYRHRGHRYISIRKFDEAIEDYLIAVELIKGTENEIEPDGLPNARNIPISTLHGNIWYHLGLAYYLKHDYQKSYEAYLNCRNSGDNDDNIVSSTHWLYMNQRRLGNIEMAKKVLEPIKLEVDIIENMSYHDLCTFYKGLTPITSLETEGGNPSSDAIKYGLASWYFYNGKKEKSHQVLIEIVNSKAWNSFGYIAAESDLMKYFGE